MFYILVIILLAIIIVIFWQISTLIGIFFGAQYVYSQDRVIKEALKLANLKKNQKFIELGSGYGWGLLAVSKLGARVTGVEISPFHYLVSKILTFGKANIQVKYGDLFRTNLSEADLIYCYLLPKALDKLLVKLRMELKSGTRVISYAFRMKSLKPVMVKQVGKFKLYLYQF